MIAISREKPITLAEAAKLAKSRPPSRATLYRWISPGVNGIRLETIRVGGSTCTSEAALQRFFDRLSEVRQVMHSNARRTRKQRLAAAKAAEKRLIRSGA
jgi:hypothetical protein